MSESLADRIRALVAARYPEGAQRAAHAMGIPNATLHKILAGGSANPRANTLQTIAEHFGASIDWLLRGSGSMPALLASPYAYPASHRAIAPYHLPEVDARILGHAPSLPGAILEALRFGRRIVHRHGHEASRAAAAYSRRVVAHQHFDAMLAALIESLELEIGARSVGDALKSPEVQALLHHIFNPFLRAGAGDVMGEIARRGPNFLVEDAAPNAPAADAGSAEAPRRSARQTPTRKAKPIKRAKGRA